MLIPTPPRRKRAKTRSRGRRSASVILLVRGACAWCLCVVLMRVLLEKGGLARRLFLSSAIASVERPDDWIGGKKKKKPKQLAAKRHGNRDVRCQTCARCALSLSHLFIGQGQHKHPSIPKAFSLVKDDTIHTYTLHTDGQIPWHA